MLAQELEAKMKDQEVDRLVLNKFKDEKLKNS